VALAKIGDLLKLWRQLLQIARPPETLDGTKLLVSGATRPDEIRVVGVGESIGARTGRGEDGALLEHEHRAPRAGKREHALDRVGTFCIGDGMPAAVGHPELHAFFRCETRDEVRALRFCRAKLEVRRARTAERRTAEQHAAQVCTATASACDDASRR